LDMRATGGLELHIIIKISLTARVAISRWLKRGVLLVGDLQVPAGFGYDGELNQSSLQVENEIIKLMNLKGFFFVPTADFDFRLFFDKENPTMRRSISGARFFFGSE